MDFAKNKHLVYLGVAAAAAYYWFVYRKKKATTPQATVLVPTP
jgi:hypothetical protein